MDSDIRFDDDRITLQARDLDLRDGNQPQGTGASARRIALQHAQNDRLVISPGGSYPNGVTIDAPAPQATIELNGTVKFEGEVSFSHDLVVEPMLRCKSSAEFAGPVVAQDMMVVMKQLLLDRPSGWPLAPDLVKRASDGKLLYTVSTLDVFDELARLRRQVMLLEQALRGVAVFVDQAIGVPLATQEVNTVLTKEMSSSQWAASQGLTDNVAVGAAGPPTVPGMGLGDEAKYSAPYIAPPKSGFPP